MSDPTTETKKLPVFTERFEGTEVAVFEWENKDGRVSHSTRLSHSFRRKNSEIWESTEFLPTSALLVAAKLLDRAHSAIQVMLEARRDNRPTELKGQTEKPTVV